MIVKAVKAIAVKHNDHILAMNRRKLNGEKSPRISKLEDKYLRINLIIDRQFGQI